MTGRTLYDKLWDSHVVADLGGGEVLLYVDRQLVHEVSSPQAFQSLRDGARGLRRSATHLAVADHAVPTRERGTIADPLARAQVAELVDNVTDFHVPYLPLDSAGQGIVHVVGPETGFTLPGITLVCGDSHTTTHGAFGALAFGIGASECGTVMAAQCLRQARAKTMRVTLTGALSAWVSAKDVALALIAKIGALGAAGYAVEYAGPAVSAMAMAARMTLCNMTIEAGGRIGLIAPDETTFAFLCDRKRAPKGDLWDAAVAYWRTLPSDTDAVFDREVTLDLSDVTPHVTWGTTPDEAAPITAAVPDPADAESASARRHAEKALAYMGLTPGTPLEAIGIDRVFIGSCTNGRIEDLRAAAAIAKGRHVAPGVSAIVVPGSTATKAAAEAEGLDRIFTEAGFEWRHAGCSMCVAMNDDRLAPGERCASTSNRNFEGRQGAGGRTHLMSPAMAAAAGIAGHLVDVRRLMA
ncbi:3-isopropylmalate/(R)-2-methylmalate dehydratase large subunit [Sphingomonas vulcanisoli]|uniref:3-isopropylmalate dehydratase large subunit n=1 Tax=Sphingomonas vulcanisoli TaxID=1658060 RepID=A0ABX0TVK3_9SPHN|nr:3-isopropylmalate dehydratase large subunit [Sphingomonas vulcanisoli]NIJ09471.1 3-isopropylmalate/(R)-2-methylmalate dehydratase large subunit [Sphingomonas vulcanisoli]